VWAAGGRFIVKDKNLGGMCVYTSQAVKAVKEEKKPLTTIS